MPDDLLPLDSKAPRQPFQLRHSDPESDFYKGKGEPVTELSWPSCRQLLYQSVATVLAHAGFQSAQESVLETLTDLVHEHYLRLSRLLRAAEKLKPDSVAEPGKSDAWASYMAEVKKYKAHQCGDDDKTRPLVK